MSTVAIIEKYLSKINYSSYFDFPFSQYSILDTNTPKLLKRDIDMDFIEALKEEYDFLILVGSEVNRHIAGVSPLEDYQGFLVSDKFLPIVSPNQVHLRPSMQTGFDLAISNISNYVRGICRQTANTDKIKLLETEEEVVEYLESLKDYDTIAMDTETNGLNITKAMVIGISISHEKEQGVYFPYECLYEDATLDLLQNIMKTKKVVYHNAKFDIPMLYKSFGLKTYDYEDTMLLHYVLNEKTGTHGLKHLAIHYTKFGFYEAKLEEFKRNYCRASGLKLKEFTYDLIPVEILGKYAGIDTAVTLEFFLKAYPVVSKNPDYYSVYTKLLKNGTSMLIDVLYNGIPFSKDRLEKAKGILADEIEEAKELLYKEPMIKKFEAIQGKPLNLNSTLQLRSLLFDGLGLKPTGILTDKGEHSLNEEALIKLQDQHPIASQILTIRKMSKIYSTYIEKLAANLDFDGRVRTGFNLTTTISGRLSSSGTFNAQQIPRQGIGAALVKGSLKARDGYKIVSQDLATAEVYVVSVLSGDKALQNVFKSGGDLHSTMAKIVFKDKIDCSVEEVAAKYGDLRSAVKAITFGILYGSGAAKVAETAKISVEEATSIIEGYFKKFSRLKTWLDTQKNTIKTNGYIWSCLGRKRRLKDVFSESKGISSHEVRSGVNFLIQSVASDINLLAAIDLNNWIKESKKEALILGMVHDSILLEVKKELVPEVISTMKQITQKDRGVSIPGYPIGVDVEVGDDYSFGKWENYVEPKV